MFVRLKPTSPKEALTVRVGASFSEFRSGRLYYDSGSGGVDDLEVPLTHRHDMIPGIAAPETVAYGAGNVK